MKRIVLLIALVAGLTATALAQPAYMNYQGRLLDSGGQPLTNGTYSLQFNIYDSPNGTNCVWGPFLCDDGSATGHVARAVVANGRFNVILGPNDTSARPLTNAFFNDDRFVEIRVNGGDPILPRQQMLSAPYALRSRQAQHAQLAQMAVQASNLVQQAADALCPPGTMVAFGGTNVPAGWLLCDGSAVASTNYSRLFAAIGSAWGNGSYHKGVPESPANPGTDFNVPDLRGIFLRGRDGGVGRDPDRLGRTASSFGDATGDAVGSLQPDAFRTHTHTWSFGLQGDDQGSGSSYQEYTRTPGSSADSIQYTGGNETRPLNAYVNYIIKY